MSVADHKSKCVNSDGCGVIGKPNHWSCSYLIWRVQRLPVRGGAAAATIDEYAKREKICDVFSIVPIYFYDNGVGVRVCKDAHQPRRHGVYAAAAASMPPPHERERERALC